MGINRLKEVVENCYRDGQNIFTAIRKVPAIASTQGSVVDLSMAPGTPRPNYYTGDVLTATALLARNGIFHGANAAPYAKYLRKLALFANNSGFAPAAITIADYLMFYPLIDMDNLDEQFFINYGLTETPTTSPSAAQLTRYTTGAGVQAFLVATNPYTGGGQFFINYTNSDGVAGRISRLMTANNYTTIATVIHSGTSANLSGTFINLAPGDKGIHSVESITFLSPQGGLASLVLCMPLANALLRQTDCYCEWDFLTMKSDIPRIYDGAYIGLLGAVNGNVAAQYLIGYAEFIWN